MPEINGERLKADLKKLRTFGAHENGVVRQALSPTDVESRQWLLAKMKAAGLDARIDNVGNVLGRSPNPGPALLMGSHTDTQPEGGWLDGAMGVIYALEIARAMSESDQTKTLALDIGSWMDEEGAFKNFIGSGSFCEKFSFQELADVRNVDGVTLGDALQAAGYTDNEPATLDPDRHIGYLEAHIEQGGVLESESKLIGVVTAIVGIRNFEVGFVGQQNHAGTTPMALRKDAAMAMFKFASGLDEGFRGLATDSTVWTFGRVDVQPGADSIVPSSATLSVQFRDPDDAVLDRMEAAFQTLLQEVDGRDRVAVQLADNAIYVTPAQMDSGFQAHIAAAAERHAPGAWQHMPSGAGHDAQVFAERVPAAMLFVPSIQGISHSFEEDTADQDIVLGCQVLADATAAILAA